MKLVYQYFPEQTSLFNRSPPISLVRKKSSHGRHYCIISLFFCLTEMQCGHMAPSFNLSNFSFMNIERPVSKKNILMSYHMAVYSTRSFWVLHIAELFEPLLWTRKDLLHSIVIQDNWTSSLGLFDDVITIFFLQYML